MADCFADRVCAAGGHPRHRARHHPEHEVVPGTNGVPVQAARQAVGREEHALHVAAAANAVRLGP